MENMLLLLGLVLFVLLIPHKYDPAIQIKLYQTGERPFGKDLVIGPLIVISLVIGVLYWG